MEFTTTSAVPSEILWINNYLSPRGITKEEIDSVLCFSLIWNLFEGLVCEKNASIAAMEDAVKKLNARNRLDLNDYEPYLKYFVKRYITDRETSGRFSRLKFRPNDRELLVRAVLEGRETDPVNTVLAMLIIVYRYRNNLFHGEKSLYDLQNQIDNFKIANKVLMTFLEKWKW